MKKYLWDTGALTLYFAGHKKIKQIMNGTTNSIESGYIPRPVFAEFYYKTWQKFGEQAAKVRTITLQNSKNKEVFIDSSEIYDVGRLKVQYPQLSMVDAQILVLGKRENATILTTDEYLTRVTNQIIKIDY